MSECNEKITRELPKLGLAAHRNTVSRIMQECGIRAKYSRKYRPTTTQSAHAHAPSPDLLERDFTADGPNKKWLCDITYIPTDEGFLYFAGVMDAWSRSNWDGHGVEHVEHAARDDYDRCADDGREAQVSTDWPSASQRSRCAICMSCLPRTSRGAWHGAEHEPCRQLLRQRHDGKPLKIVSLWATLKKELVHGQRFRTHDEARSAIFEWIEVWYQRIRIHGSLGYVSPEAFEATERVG